MWFLMFSGHNFDGRKPTGANKTRSFSKGQRLGNIQAGVDKLANLVEITKEATADSLSA